MLKKIKNKFFDNLTMVPIDKDLINSELLNKGEKNWLTLIIKKFTIP